MARYILFIVFLLLANLAKTHTATTSLKSNLQRADLIILGEVTESHSFWDTLKKNIYTSYTIKVDTVIKGTADSEIKVLVQGGIVENVWQKISSAASLKLNDKGYFLLNLVNSTDAIPFSSSTPFYRITGDGNGFLHVEADTQKGKSKVKSNLLPEFFYNLKALINYTPTIYENKTIPLKSVNTNSAITQLSPLELTAGTGEILNIHGYGFGAQQNSSEIWFNYADQENSSFTHAEFEIKLWSDTLIRIVVPSEAATGTVSLKTAGQDVVSPEVVKIRYAHSNLYFKPIFLINSDDLGGYTWHLHSSIASIPQAAKIIENAIGKWVCATSVPWTVGSTTTNKDGIDGMCTILLDSLGGPLGKTSAVYEKVFTTPKNYKWVLAEVDIVIEKNHNWSFSRENMQIDQMDFETVILHELAHAQLIGHVNDKEDLMHCNLSAGIIKNIGSDNIACSDFIINNSLEFNNRSYSTINPVHQEALGIPEAITGPENLCANALESTYYISKVTNASGYKWEIIPQDAAILVPEDTLVNVLWSGEFNGEASLTVYPENFCGSLGSNSNLMILIDPGFNSEETVSICQGESYNGWETEGIYIRQLNTGNGCDSMLTTYLSVEELTEPIVLINNDTISCNESFASYQWYNENGKITGAVSNKYIVEYDGTYYLEVTNENGCSTLSEKVNVIKTTIPETVIKSPGFTVFPNPGNGNFTIKLENYFSVNASYEIFNQTGQCLLRKEINTYQGTCIEQVDLNKFPKGVYFIKVSGYGPAITEKLIKK